MNSWVGAAPALVLLKMLKKDADRFSKCSSGSRRAGAWHPFSLINVWCNSKFRVLPVTADVSRNRVMQIKGFGESLTRAATDWRASVERRFVFNPKIAISEADKNAVRAKIGARRSAIATVLVGGAGELRRVGQSTMARANALKPQLDQAAKQLAQEKSDLIV